MTKRLVKHEKPYWWQKEVKEFYSGPHPKEWFEFLGWITALSTLQLLSEKTGSGLIKIIYILSLGVLYGYLNRVLYAIQFQRALPNKFSEKQKKIITYVLATILVVAVYQLVAKISEEITKAFNL